MKFINIRKASLGFAIISAYSGNLMATASAPQEIIKFATEHGLALQKIAAIPVNKYPIETKAFTLSGKLSVKGNATYQGYNFPFAAPASNAGVQKTTYIFGRKQATGKIPFTLKTPYGSFGGIMTPVSPDNYTLKMLSPHGSLLSGIAHSGQKNSGDVWKNTRYSYTATVTKKLLNGRAVKVLQIKELASFKINLITLPGASANYTYSYDWRTQFK